MTAPIRADESGGVLEIVIDRPERRNALSLAAIDALGTIFDALAGRDDVGAVVVRGADGAFCAGLDLKEIDLADPPTEAWVRVHEAIDRVAAPVVGAVTGPAVNAGAALALACDLLVVGEHAYIQVMEASIGMAPPLNAAWLTRGYPASVGRQLVLSCRRFYGPDLLRLGVAFDVVPDSQVVPRARELAATLASYPRRGATVAKQTLRRANSTTEDFPSMVAAIVSGGPR